MSSRPAFFITLPSCRLVTYSPTRGESDGWCEYQVGEAHFPSLSLLNIFCASDGLRNFATRDEMFALSVYLRLCLPSSVLSRLIMWSLYTAETAVATLQPEGNARSDAWNLLFFVIPSSLGSPLLVFAVVS